MGLWKEIRKEVAILINCCVFNLKDGRRVRFQEDK